MVSLITGALIISLLHAAIPNHWLPIIAIGRKENWSLPEVTRVTLVCALSHGVSTILIGVLLSLLGAKLEDSLINFTNIIAPIILVSIGLFFIYRHHNHKHFEINGQLKKSKSKNAITAALILAMFFSPCMEIEAYFLLAGTQGKWIVLCIAFLYLAITITGMLLLVRFAYKGLLKLNWHSLEHNAGIITGATLIATGLISFFIQ